MRVLFLSPVGVIGGAERVLLDSLASLRRAAPDIELGLVAGADGPLVPHARALGVRVAVVPLPASVGGIGDSALVGQRRSRWRTVLRTAAAAPDVWRYTGRLRRVIAAFRPDVIHSNGIKTHLLGRLARPAGVPLVWHVHDFLGERPLVRRVLPLFARGVAGVVAISDAVARDVRAVLPRVRIAVVRNAVDVDRFAPGPAADLDAPAGVVRIGLVATYARWKGQDVFLRAAAEFVRTAPGPARFFIVGGPIYQTHGSQYTEAELRELTESLSVAEHVRFVGFRQDTAAVYNALDVVVHASTRPEPFGLTIAEAMACGRAVVVTAAGGAAELFRDGVDALDVPPGDVARLAAALRTLTVDADLRSRLGAAARAAACERFHRDRLGPELLAAYRRWRARG